MRVLVVAAVLLAGACGGSGPGGSPDTAVTGFLNAMLDRDVKDAYQYVDIDDRDRDSFVECVEDSGSLETLDLIISAEVSIDSVDIDGDTAVVETTLDATTVFGEFDDSSEPLHLTRVDGRWKLSTDSAALQNDPAAHCYQPEGTPAPSTTDGFRIELGEPED